MTEEWATFPFDNRYQISDLGRVRFVATGRIRKLVPIANGYLTFMVVNGKKNVLRCVHRAVIEAFNGPIPEELQVCHWDGDKTNNKLSNLRVDTSKSNHYDKRRHGTHLEGEAISTSKLTKGQVLEIVSADQGSYLGAKRYGVTPGQIMRIRSGENWGWLTHGVPRGVSGSAKLTDEQVIDIFTSKESGEAMSRKHAISAATVSRIRTGKAWRETTAKLKREES